MKLDIFTLCDAAGITTERKLVIHGAFDNIFAAGVPFTYPALSIAIRLRCDLADEGRHTLALRFLGSDGGELLPTLKGELNVRPPVNGTLRTFCVDHIINLRNVVIPRFEEYEITLLIDGEALGSVPFTTTELPSR